MASGRVSVWASDLYYDWLPPVCWRTGRPADGRLPVTFRSGPRESTVFFVFGLLAYLLVRAFYRPVSVSGVLPMHSDALHDFEAARRAPYALGGMAAVLFAAGFLAQSVPLVLASAAFLLATMVVSAALTLRMMVRGRIVVADGVPDRFVVLRNVHPAFAAAVRENYRRRAEHASQLPLTPSTHALNVGPPQPD